MIKDYYIFSNGRLKRKDNTLYFYDQDENRRTLPIENMDNLYVFGEIELNSSFLNLLNQHDICLHIFNYYGFYAGTFYPRTKKVSGYTVVKQSAHYLDKKKRIEMASHFVRSAAFHMLRNLRHYQNSTQDHMKKIQELIPTIELVTTIPELMGVEGSIRQIYYDAFNTFLPKQFAFDQRSKRPPNDPLNALISFGNSICYTAILSEIYKTHLDPTVSYLHEPSSRRFSLCLDLSEIFKPLLVDPTIFSLINKRMISAKDFTSMDNAVLLNENGRKKFMKVWDDKLSTTIKHRKLNRKVSYRYFIRLECYKLIKHFLGDSPYKPLRAWW